MAILDYRKKRIVVVDFETFFSRKNSYDLKSLSIAEYVRDSRFWALGLAYRFLDDDKTHWLSSHHAIEAWVASVDWPSTVVVAHNCKFDGAILSWRYGAKPFAWMDTMALAKATLGENVSGYSLKRLAEYLGLPAKGELSCEGVLHPTPEQLEELGSYCRNDVDLCRGIYDRLMPQFPQGQLWHVDWTIRAFVEPRLALDEKVLEKGVGNEKKRREEIISRSGIDKKILSSNKQFAELLSSRDIQTPTKTSARTGRQIPAFSKTDAGLDQLKSIAPDLYDARIAAKSNLLETRGESLLAVAKTGSFPFDVGFSGAVQTHRYSGGSGAGGNPQNFTRNSFLRGAVRAPEGSQLVVGDFAAIELRLLAWLAKEPRLIGKLLNDEDVYADFASLKYGRRITKADKAERQFGKCSILGLGYNMGSKKFKLTAENAMKALVAELKSKNLPWEHIQTVVSEDDAWKTVDLYRSTYFNVPKLWEQAHNLLPLISGGKISCLWFAPFIKVRRNTLVLPSGLTIQYPNLRSMTVQGRNGSKVEWIYDVYHKVYEAEPTKLYGGKIIENICQALAGELCKEAIERAEADGIRCVGQVHDEIIAITRDGCSDNDVKMDAFFLKKHMERSPKWLPNLRLKAEVSHGNDWNSAKV